MDQHETSPALDTFWSCARAFQALDPKAVATHFHEPSMLISPQGVRALPNIWAVERTYAEIMEVLHGSHYSRTEFARVSERRLSDVLVELGGSGTWVDDRGQRYMSFGFTYTLLLTELGYRIVVAAIHTPPAT